MEGTGYYLRILGPPAILSGDGTPVDLAAGKPLALLAFLHLSEEPVSRDHLGRLLWPDATRERARGSVRHALWLLRRTLDEGLFIGDDPVGVATSLLSSDLREFRDRLAAGDAVSARELWTGPPLQDLKVPDAPEWTRWADGLRLELEERYAAALSERGRREWEEGRPDEAVPWLRGTISVQPYRIRHHLDLAETLLDLRKFEEAGHTLVQARGACDSPAQLRDIEEVERRLLAVRRGARSGERGSDPLQFSFVGRTEEFALLVQAWRQARGGRSRVGLITGDPGIGKTRLSEEVALVAGAEGSRVVHVKAEDSERPIEWGLVAEVVQRLMKLSGAAGVSRASDQVLRTLLPSLALSDPGRDEGLGRAGPVLRPRTRPSAALTDALMDLIHAVAEDAPLFVILDDLQWADTESRAVLARVATHLQDIPILLLFTCRTEANDPRIGKTLTLLAEASGSTAVELKPWSVEELDHLLGLLVDFPSPEEAQRVTQRIHRASRGSPLFVMELLKVLQEEQYLEEREDGRWILRPQRLPPDLPLPESVRGLVDRQMAQLSDEGTMVAAHLARIGHPASPRTLALRTGMGASAVTNGIGELLQRRMIRWEDGDSLGFTHDEIRAAVARRFQLDADAPSGDGLRWPPGPAALAAGVALLVMAAVALATQRPSASPPLPFGAGEIQVHSGDALHAFELRSLAADGLHHLETRPPGPGTGIPSSRGSGGWELGQRARSEGEGTDLVVTRRAGMDGQDPGFSTDERVVLQAEGTIRFAGFAPSMDRITAALMGRPDSLVVLTLGGEFQSGIAVPSLLDAVWCGDREMALLVREEGAVHVLFWSPDSGELRVPELGDLAPGGSLACSPDGSALLLQGARDGGVGLYLHLRGGETLSLQLPEGVTAHQVDWLPPEGERGPEALRIAGQRERTLAWGEALQLEAHLVGAEGGVPAQNLRWSARDGDRVRVGSGGRLVGTEEGSTWIVAEWSDWLQDSIRVQVQGSNHPRALLQEPAVSPELPGWRSYALSGADGTLDLLNLHEVWLPEGGTLEVEFRLPLDRREGQWMEVCLESAAREPDPFEQRPGPGACMRYPAGTGSRWDPREVELRPHAPFPGTVKAVPRLLPSEEWVPVALRVGAEGEVTGFVGWGGARLGTPVRLEGSGESSWRVRLRGGAEGTELQFRRLTLWSGTGPWPQ